MKLELKCGEKHLTSKKLVSHDPGHAPNHKQHLGLLLRKS